LSPLNNNNVLHQQKRQLSREDTKLKGAYIKPGIETACGHDLWSHLSLSVQQYLMPKYIFKFTARAIISILKTYNDAILLGRFAYNQIKSFQ
jgi:hypothetical protein